MSCLLYGLLLQLNAFQLGQRAHKRRVLAAGRSTVPGGTDAHQNHPSFSFTQTTKAKFLMEKRRKKSRFSLLDNNYRGKKKKKKESNCFSCRFSSKALGTAAMKGHFAGEVANVSTEVMENIPIK